MKKLFTPIIALAAIAVIAGCSTKFNIGAPYKNITVVYGFLDFADTAHYIRIQKAFLDQNKNAITMSQTPDSSFYANLNVTMREIGANGGIVDNINMNRVDLDLEGYPKQAGQFFNSPNYAYKFKNQLNAAYTYRLVITDLTTGGVDSSETAIFDDGNNEPVPVFNVDALVVPYNLTALDFATTGPNEGLEGIRWTYLISPNAIGITQGILTFNWVDSNYVTHILTPHSYDYSLGYTTSQQYKPLNTDLYTAIFSGMGVAPPYTYRLMNRCNLAVYLSTTDFVNYQQATLSQGLGLTGSDIEPIYTNIKGDAIGLYTGRGVRSGPITITDDTIDSLIISPYLAPCRIVGTVY